MIYYFYNRSELDDKRILTIYKAIFDNGGIAIGILSPNEEILYSRDNFERQERKIRTEEIIEEMNLCDGIILQGGTTKEIPNPEKHMKMNEKYVHSVKIDKNSKIYTILQKEEIMVNSRHKRTVDTCPCLEKVGFCEDGYADIVEAKEKTFCIGVRFHPESLYKEDANMNQIFKSFIERCRLHGN